MGPFATAVQDKQYLDFDLKVFNEDDILVARFDADPVSFSSQYGGKEGQGAFNALASVQGLCLMMNESYKQSQNIS